MYTDRRDRLECKLAEPRSFKCHLHPLFRHPVRMRHDVAEFVVKQRRVAVALGLDNVDDEQRAAGLQEERKRACDRGDICEVVVRHRALRGCEVNARGSYEMGGVTHGDNIELDPVELAVHALKLRAHSAHLVGRKTLVGCGLVECVDRSLADVDANDRLGVRCELTRRQP